MPGFSTIQSAVDAIARGEVIIAFATALGTAGLDELEHIARERLDHGAAGKHQYLAVALENIADARGDVEMLERTELSGHDLRAAHVPRHRVGGPP